MKQAKEKSRSGRETAPTFMMFHSERNKQIITQRKEDDKWQR